MSAVLHWQNLRPSLMEVTEAMDMVAMEDMAVMVMVAMVDTDTMESALPRLPL